MAIVFRQCIAACFCLVAVAFITVQNIQANDLKKQQVLTKQWEHMIDGVRMVLPVPRSSSFLCHLKDEVLLLNGSDGKIKWRLKKLYSTVIIDRASDRCFGYDRENSVLDAVSLNSGLVESTRPLSAITRLLASSSDGMVIVAYEENTLVGAISETESEIRRIASIDTLADTLQLKDRIKRLQIVNIDGEHIFFALNGHLGIVNANTSEAQALNVHVQSQRLLDFSAARLYSIRSKRLIQIDVSRNPPEVKELAEIPVGHDIAAGFLTPDGKQLIFAEDTAEHQAAYLCAYSLSSAATSAIPWGNEEVASLVANDERTYCISANRAGMVAGWKIK